MQTQDKRRFWLGVVYLGVVVSGVYTFLHFGEKIFFNVSPINNPYLMFGRIWFSFWCGLLGISLRAFKFSRNGRVSPWMPYLFKYPVLIFFESVFVFSILNMSEIISLSYLFYTFTLPVMFYLGFGAFEAYSELKQLLRNNSGMD
ncbi:MAG: hypothetical protein UT29_C0002G0011 [Candidatus Yanofskybacteria bacterium GW2011_GWA1_39_13]|uniref:Uncharacterized protein n=1 Tax=Yanofskybacteria sp. (strain GW2011_GWA1_39_13) TaxID=1619019 RepID=A0A0G0MED9_YANXG|nr:MAG: hypothetical protein UT29_C0002G0011 [Candidatus Yanofskybacteria bacterium GW2011_GWA1_39_13]